MDDLTEIEGLTRLFKRTFSLSNFESVIIGDTRRNKREI